MKKSLIFTFLLIVSLQCSCFSRQAYTLDHTTLEFLDLLATNKEVSLREFSGLTGGDGELGRDRGFEIMECEAKGWLSYPEDIELGSETSECFAFRKERAFSEDAKSLYMTWLKKRFSTVGKKYKVLSMDHNDSDFLEGVCIRISIGNHIFNLSRTPDLHTEIVVNEIDGRPESAYYPESVHRWLKRK